MRGLPPVERAAAGVVGEAVRAQPGGDLADGLGGEAGAFGELQSADAVGAGGAEQSEHESGVVAAQPREVHVRILGADLP